MGKLQLKGYSILLIIICMLPMFATAQTDYEQQIQYIDSVNSLSFQYVTTNPSQAQIALNEALTLADSLEYREGMARALEQLSWASSYLGNWDETVELRIRSIRIYEELGMKLQAGYGFSELAWSVRRRSLERAEYFMTQGLELLEEHPQSVELSNAYNNYGIIKLEQDQIDSAIYFIERSLAIKEANKDTLGIAYSYGYLGSAFQELEDFDTAINYLEDSFRLKGIMNDSSGMAIDLTNIAANYRSQNNLESAATYFRRSVNMALEIDYKHLAEHNYSSLANLFENIAQYDSSLHYYKLYDEVRDSRLDETNSERLAELEVQFETEQKEKELAIQRAELASSQLQIRNRNWILSALGGALLFGGIITAMVMRQQKIKQRENELKLKLAKSETQNRIHEERERISRDLHDNVGAQITSLISGLEISNLYVKNNKTNDALDLIDTLDSNARDAMSELRETIWLLNTNEIPVEDFITHLQSYIKKHQTSLGELKVEVQNKIDEQLTLNPQQSLNMLRIIQEALTNCVKYAQASTFDIQFYQKKNKVKVKLSDDGEGSTKHQEVSMLNGNGLMNMRKRIHELNGNMELNTTNNSGWSMEFTFPV